MKKEKLLIICWTIHPWPTGSSIIVNNLVENMKKDSAVVVGEKHTTLFSAWPENLPKLYYINPNLNFNGRGQTHLRWIKYLSVENQVKNIALKEEVTKILGIFPDDFYLFLAYRLSKKLNIPLYSWFHNTYLDNYTGYRKIFASYLQPKVFNRSKKVFVMSDGMKNYFNSRYQNINFSTLVHGFKLPEFSLQPISENKIQTKKVKFLFTGSLNESCRDASVRMMKVIINQPHYELHAYTGNPKIDFENYGISGDRFFYHGFINLFQLYEEMKNFDIMLLPHGFIGNRTDVEFKTIFPTRTIPLLLSGKPILAHAPAETFLVEFLIKNDCAWVVTTQNEFQILETIKEILNNENEVLKKVKNAKKTLQKFDVNSVLGKLKSEIGFFSF